MINPTLALGADNGNERAKVPVMGSTLTSSQSGNYTLTQGVDFPVLGRELWISNDNNNNMTFVVNGDGGALNFMIQPGEMFDERLPLFSNVVVTATGGWRWRVRGNIS